MRETIKSTDLAIIDYAEAHATAFHDINAEWIRSMFVLEAHDVHVLTHPRETILDPGGVILLAVSGAHGVIGTCALMKVADGVFELTKMGVREIVRGQKAGEVLLLAMLECDSDTRLCSKSPKSHSFWSLKAFLVPNARWPCANLVIFTERVRPDQLVATDRGAVDLATWHRARARPQPS